MKEQSFSLAKGRLNKKLAEISVKISDKLSRIKANDGQMIDIRPDYDPEEFGFSPGQFVSRTGGCGHGSFSYLGICVGVGKGCPNDPEKDEIWFLFQHEEGISHFCNKNAKDFEESDILLVE